ncbi:hypothetical protein SNK04_014173 [Fusarium graminearum]
MSDIGFILRLAHGLIDCNHRHPCVVAKNLDRGRVNIAQVTSARRSVRHGAFEVRLDRRHLIEVESDGLIGISIRHGAPLVPTDLFDAEFRVVDEFIQREPQPVRLVRANIR